MDDLDRHLRNCLIEQTPVLSEEISKEVADGCRASRIFARMRQLPYNFVSLGDVHFVSGYLTMQ